MLKIIRDGKSTCELPGSRRSTSRKEVRDEQRAFLRAPGISTEKPKSILKPIARAATMPTELKPRDSVDFEPFQGPSLFSNLKRSMATDERIKHWQQGRDRALSSNNPSQLSRLPTVCGDATQDVRHVYLTSDHSQELVPRRAPMAAIPLVACKKCTILCEALDRLRKNLTTSEQSSPRSEAQPITANAVTKEDLARRSNTTQPTMQQRGGKVAKTVDECMQKRSMPQLRQHSNSIQNEEMRVPRGRLSQPTISQQAALRHELATGTIKQSRPLSGNHSDAHPRQPPYLPTPPAGPPPLHFSEPAAMSLEDWRKHQDTQLENLRNTQRVIQSNQQQPPQPNTVPQPKKTLVEQACETLNDLRLQRENNDRLGIRRTPCTLGTEQAALPPLPALPPSVMESGPKVPVFIAQDKVSQVQAHIRFLEAKLRTHEASGLGSARTFQVRKEIEEKLVRLGGRLVELLA